MKNPFTYGREVAGSSFCNRKKEIEEIYRDIVNSQNVIIFSQRRFGKTSLIKEVLKKAQKEGVLTIYVDIYSVLTEEDLIRIYAKAVAEIALGKLERGLRDAAKLFKSIRPKLTLDENGKPIYSIDIINKRETLPLLEDVLESVNRYADRKKKKAVVVLDEFQQIGQFKTDRAEKTMRSVFQKHKNISYIFMGSKKHLIFDMFNNPNRPFYRSAKPFPLEKIGKSEFMSFIKNKFKSTGKIITDVAVEKIIDICECHPYYIQYFCHIILERAIDKQKISENNLKEGLELLLSRESSTYEATWDLLTVKQKQVLLALSAIERDTKLFSSEFLEKNNLGSASSVQRTIQALVNKDLVDKEGDLYTVIDILFKKWLLGLNKD